MASQSIRLLFLWEIIRIVQEPLRFSIIFKKFFSFSKSKELVASSKMMISDFLYKDLAIDNLWSSPPENFAPPSPIIVLSPFFKDLIQFMTRGPIVAAALEKSNAVDDFRKLIGSTDPTEAEEGTIRKRYAKSKGENAVHGSDSDENASIEISFHFSDSEIFI